jgi:subtilisin family serine protease
MYGAGTLCLIVGLDGAASVEQIGAPMPVVISPSASRARLLLLAATLAMLLAGCGSSEHAERRSPRFAAKLVARRASAAVPSGSRRAPLVSTASAAEVVARRGSTALRPGGTRPRPFSKASRAAGAPRKPPSPQFVPGQVVLTIRSDVSVGDRVRLARSVGGGLTKRLPGDIDVITVPARRVRAAISKLDRNRAVRAAGLNAVGHGAGLPSPVNTSFSSQCGLFNTGANIGQVCTVGDDIHAPEAWDVAGQGAGVTIAFADSGVDTANPAIALSSAPGYDYVSDDSNINDLNGHGTATAGTAVADGYAGDRGAGRGPASKHLGGPGA